ncbi:MAG: hypothetical protein Aurels2KO_14790 [Aureliella sp.]
MRKFSSVDDYMASLETFKHEAHVLRQVVLKSGLDECVKWSFPCYTDNGKNIVGLGVFKSYFGLWFFDGAQIDDKHNVLINAQEGKTRAMRQWRMTAADEIRPRIIGSYIKAARKVAADGKTIKPQRTKTVGIPPELKSALSASSKLEEAFAQLRPARQREFAQYIADAKRPDTKLRRIEKITPMILENVGLHDKYRS